MAPCIMDRACGQRGGGSKALQAEALDFFGDAANYAISLGVAGMALAWRARAALLKGVTLMVLGLYVLIATLWAVMSGGMPEAEIMGESGLRRWSSTLLLL